MKYKQLQMKRELQKMMFLKRKLFVLLPLIFFGFASKAQTTLIDPLGDGGFETGTTFTANGWSVSNGTNNPWIIGTAVSNSFFSNRSVYISDNGTNNTYTSVNNALNFFWRDITIPAGEPIITLTFDWNCMGEGNWDMWQVFTGPTTIIPSGVNTYPGNGTNTVPAALAGATFIGNGSPNNSPQKATLTLPRALVGTTFRLIFSWKNETGGDQPPAAIDNIKLISRPAIAPDVPVNMTFSAIGKSVTTVNWQDNSITENGFRVYRSTNPVTGFAQVGSDILSTTTVGTGTTYSCVNTGLNPSVTYYYRVYSFADDTSLTSLTGSQITDPPGYVTTTATGGNWSAATTWVGGGVPTSSDTAVIATGATVIVDAAVNISKVMLNTGSTVYMNANLVDSTDLEIASGATFNSFLGTTGRTLTVFGNINNAGTLNMNTPSSTLVMLGRSSGAVAQTISGAGTFSLIPTLTINNTAGVLLNSNLNVAQNLNLTNGVLAGTANLRLGNASFNNTFTMTSTGGRVDCPVVSGLAGVATVNYNYNAASPNAPYATGNELSITAPNLNVTIASVTGGNIILGTNAIVNNMTFNGSLTVDAPYTLTVNGNATFTAAPVASGSGTFTMGTNGTITTANLGGITMASAAGSVQTAIRNYRATGNYTYNGAATQVTGDGLPGLLTAGTVTSSTANGLKLSQITVFNNLTITTNLNTDGWDVTVNGIANLGTSQITGTGAFTAGASSRLLLGNTNSGGVIQASSANGNFLNTGVRTFTPGCDIILGGTAAATGDGFPVTGIDTLVLNQTSQLTLTVPVSVNTLYITNTGRLTTTSTNLLTILGGSSTNVARSSTGYIDGPLARTIASGASAGGYLFPLGSGATSGLGIELINPVVTASNIVLTAVSFNMSSGGTTGTGLTALNTNRYWAFASVSGGGTLSSVGNVRIYETNTAGIALAKKVGVSKGFSSSGVYDAIGGSVDSNSISIMSALTIPAFATAGDSTYFVLGAGPSSGVAFAGGTYTVGPTGDYNSLTSAIAAINERTSLTGSVILEFQAAYNPNVETYPIVFRATLPTNATNRITIRPSAAVSAPINFSGYTVSSLPLFDFNGGKNIVIDGRPGGTGTNRYISINQLQSGSGFPAVRFINDAQNNVLRRLNVSSLNNIINTAGSIFFSNTNAGTAATNGNNNDTIDYCYIDGKSVAPNSIYASGSNAPADNKNVVISNCNFYDFYTAGTGDVFAIRIAGGNTAWTISGNNFYQTVIRNSASIPAYNPAISIGAVQINNNAGNGFNILNNTFGGNIAGIPGSVFSLGDSTIATSGATGTLKPFDLSSVGTTVPSLVMGNTISNITHYVSSSVAECFVGIAVYGGACNIINNTIGSSTGNNAIRIFYRGTSSPSAIQGFRHGASGGGAVTGNTIGSLTAEVQGVQATGYVHIQGIVLGNTTFTSPLSVAGNTIGSATTSNSIMGSANSLTPVAMTGIIDNGATGAAITITGNTIANLASFSSVTSTNNFTRGIFVTGASSVSTSITGNTIRNLTSAGLNNNGDVASTVVGIANSKNGTGTQWIAGNTIHSLISTNGINYANNIVGIYYSATNTATNNRIEMNTIHSLQTVSANNLATQQGIVSGGGSVRTGIYNNMIRLGFGVTGTSITGSNQMIGINKTGGIISALHNTVYIGGSGVASGSVNTFAFNRGSVAADSVFNNIFVNERSNASGTGAHYAISLNNNTTFVANNNLYRASGTGGVLGFYSTVNQTTIGAWKAASSVDQYSFSADPAFIAPNGSATTVDLHISGSTPTPIEGAGAILAGTAVLTDFDGQDRGSLTPTDVGADAGNFILSDVVPPAIAYTAKTNSLIASNILSNVTISDASGVNTTAGTKPRLYYKKKTEDNAYVGNTNANNGWKHVEATNASSPFSFTMDYALLNSTIAVGDTIQYFVTAQDLAGTVHVSANNAVFAVDPATVALTGAAFPVTGNINSFKIMDGISGTLTVGVSAPADYPTLTQAINDINNKIITSPVILELIDVLYTSPAETFPITIKDNPGSSPSNTLTIRPAAGVTTEIIDSITHAIVDLNGIDYLILDGRQGGTGTPKSLSIINRSVSNATYGSAVIPNNIPNAVRFINDATNNKLKHIKMLGACGSEVSGVVFFSIGTVVGNSDNLIDSCDIGDVPGSPSLPWTLFVGQGSADQVARFNRNVTISNCNIYNHHSVTGESNALKISKGNTAWTITGNHFYQTATRTASGGTHYIMNLNRRVDYIIGGGHPEDPNGFAFNSLNNMVITNNYFGGSAPFAAGAPWTLNGSGSFSGLYMEFGNYSNARVSGNIFTNFQLDHTAAGDRWRGIWIVKGFINADSNIFGSETAKDAIVLNTTVSGAGILVIQANPGIDLTPAGTWSISGNKIGGLSVKGSAAASGYIAGILVNGTSSAIHTYNIGNNTIGNTLDSNIVVSGNSTAGASPNVYIVGINNTSSANMNIRNNTIRNIYNTNMGTAAGLTHGISSTGGIDSITGNFVSNLVSATPQTAGTPTPAAGSSVMGIYMAPSTAGNLCSNNTIRNLLNNNTGAANVSVVGINVNNMTASEVSGNAIRNLTVASTGTGSVIAGINQMGGSIRAVNNMISLGLDTNDAPITKTPVIVGLYKNGSGSMAAYHNSVLINGDNTGSGVANTYAFRRGTTGVDSLKNNIFINLRSNAAAGGAHYAIGLNENNTLVSDYNVMHVGGSLFTGDTLIVSGTTTPAYTTLLDWQTASSKDANSKDSVVAFVSATNLHLDPTMYGVLTLKGTPIAGVTRDRDGDLRTITPYIGADEIPSAPLPVKLLSFKANLLKDDVLATWNTASEINNKGFFVERSANGKGNWEAVGFVRGKENSQVVTNYQFRDVNPFTAKTTALYYRLRQVDMDGRETLSEVVLVNKNSRQATAISAYPNPFNSTTVSVQFVSETDGMATVSIIDITGKVVLSLNKQIAVGNNVVSVEGTERLQSGIYFLTTEINNEKQTLKLIKQ